MILQDANFLNPYVIAEIGVNHGGDLSLAKQMIEQAAQAGAHAAKFQTYKADRLATKDHSPAYWDVNEEPCTSQHALFSKYDGFEASDYEALAAQCQQSGIDFLSTPFDLEAVAMLAPMMPYVKIASADITNVPLLRAVAKLNKPVLLSTGAASETELERALEILASGVSDITLLHCVLNYPTPPERAQIGLMDALQKAYGHRCCIGYSDHVPPQADGTMPALELAVLQGAHVIEKHFTYDKTLQGNDHYHAMNAADLKAFIDKLAMYRTLYGNGERQLAWEQQAIDHARRRIVLARDVKAGEALNESMLIALRSHTGIEVAQWDEVMGKKTKRDMAQGQPLHKTDLA